MNRKTLNITILSLLITSCAAHELAEPDVQKKFTYDFSIKGKDKNELWENARNHYATTFGDSRAVLRVQDIETSTIIGKAGVGWTLTGIGKCYSTYNFRFLSKDNKARLQLELEYGAATYSECTYWTWPTKKGYEEIKLAFNKKAKELELVLTKGSEFNNF